MASEVVSTRIPTRAGSTAGCVVARHAEAGGLAASTQASGPQVSIPEASDEDLHPLVPWLQGALPLRLSPKHWTRWTRTTSGTPVVAARSVRCEFFYTLRSVVLRRLQPMDHSSWKPVRSAARFQKRWAWSMSRDSGLDWIGWRSP